MAGMFSLSFAAVFFLNLFNSLLTQCNECVLRFCKIIVHFALALRCFRSNSNHVVRGE
jgi:hypothetical protein